MIFRLLFPIEYFFIVAAAALLIGIFSSFSMMDVINSHAQLDILENCSLITGRSAWCRRKNINFAQWKAHNDKSLHSALLSNEYSTYCTLSFDLTNKPQLCGILLKKKLFLCPKSIIHIWNSAKSGRRKQKCSQFSSTQTTQLSYSHFREFFLMLLAKCVHDIIQQKNCETKNNKNWREKVFRVIWIRNFLFRGFFLQQKKVVQEPVPWTLWNCLKICFTFIMSAKLYISATEGQH